MNKSCRVILLLLFFPFILLGQTDTVLFSSRGGFYDESFTLALESQQGHRIRYTVNGETPTASSTLYNGPFLLDEQCFSRSNIHTIVNCIPSIYHAVTDVERVIVIRAAAFDGHDNCVSSIVTNTYIIKSLGSDTHGLPVVSIAADSLALFDYNTGIFVPGVNYDPADSTHTGNYYQRGIEWERRINVEFYETNNWGINQICGLRTHGGASRFFQQKGMRLYAREEYGKKRFKHQFFITTPIDRYKHLNLHPFRCSNWLQTGGQEYLSQMVGAQLNVDGLGVREVTVFINGEYWGIYTLEESPDERYLEDHYEVNLEEVNVLKFWGVPQYGDPTDCRNFRAWISDADLTQPEDSAYAFSHMDVPSYIDYLILETYGANLDWPTNNVLIWQAMTGAPFRMLFYDGDGCFTRWYFHAVYNAMNQGRNSLITNKFFENEGFKRMFQQRYYELSTSVFSYDALKHIWDRYRSIVEEEIPRQSERFGFPKSVQRWQSDMDSTEAFFLKRSRAYEQELFDLLSVEEAASLEFSVFPNPNKGVFYILLDTDENVLLPIEMFDCLGRRVYYRNSSFVGKTSVRVSAELPPGLYLLRVGHRSKRIVIQ